jgi:tRNA A-37 threonylcarbamoyl transferase component Bud32
MHERSFQPGQLIAGRYKIIELIGKGASAVVYRAFDTKLNREVALKIIPRKAGLEERVKREIRVAASLNHPTIVHLYDFLVSEDYYVVVLELVEGISLRKMIERKKKLPWDKATYIAIQLASALEEAHKKQILHKDIKPENVLVTKDGKVKLTDFGIASLITRSRERAVSGTIGYMSPEQLTGKYLDETSDIFSLGVILYEMLTGVNPFIAPDVKEAAHRVLNLNPEEPHLIDPSIPKKLSDIVMKSIAKDPDFRFQSAAVLKKALVDFQKETLAVVEDNTSHAAEKLEKKQKVSPTLILLRVIYFLTFFYLLLTASPLLKTFGGSVGIFIILALAVLGLFNPQAANIVAYFGLSSLAISSNLALGLALFLVLGVFLLINSTYHRNLLAPLPFLEIKTVDTGIYPFSPYLLIVLGDEAVAFTGSLASSLIVLLAKLNGGLTTSPFFSAITGKVTLKDPLYLLKLFALKPVLIFEIFLPALVAYLAVITERSLTRKQRYGFLTSVLTFAAAYIFGYQILNSVFKLGLNIGQIFALNLPGILAGLAVGALFNLLKGSHETS